MPHTLHIVQPLDVGIFGCYKAAFRRSVSDPALRDIDVVEFSEATRNRIRMLGRALISQLHALNSKSIKRAFFHTGIFPLSPDQFLVNCRGLRNIPPDVMQQAKDAVQGERDARNRRVIGKGRRNIVNEALFVDSTAAV